MARFDANGDVRSFTNKNHGFHDCKQFFDGFHRTHGKLQWISGYQSIDVCSDIRCAVARQAKPSDFTIIFSSAAVWLKCRFPEESCETTLAKKKMNITLRITASQRRCQCGVAKNSMCTDRNNRFALYVIIYYAESAALRAPPLAPTRLFCTRTVPHQNGGAAVKIQTQTN